MDLGAELYRQYLEGDQDAFKRLLEEYRDSLIFFLNRTVNNLDTAEELAAEAFAELIIHPGRYRGKVSFKTYLYAIAHHKMVDRIRREVRHPQISYEEAGEKSLSYRSFEEQVLASEQNRLLYEALGELKEEYRIALYLVYFEDMSYAQAAVIMKKTGKQAENLIYRGKQALRTILEKKGFTYEN